MIGCLLTSNSCSSHMIGTGRFRKRCAVDNISLALFSRGHLYSNDHSKVNPGGKKLLKFIKPRAMQASPSQELPFLVSRLGRQHSRMLSSSCLDRVDPREISELAQSRPQRLLSFLVSTKTTDSGLFQAESPQITDFRLVYARAEI